MADGRPPATQLPPVATAPPVVPPAPPMLPPAPPAQPAVPPVQLDAPPVQPGPMPQLRWSHFKPEFAGKPDEDVEAHLLRTNDWMNTHAFPEGVKVQKNFDENSETFDFYVTCIRQVALLLGCGKQQVLEAFKYTLPSRLYCVLFPKEDLRQAVEKAKQILTKEKIDRQLAGQS